jgi:hypothetical protein
MVNHIDPILRVYHIYRAYAQYTINTLSIHYQYTTQYGVSIPTTSA